MRAMGCFVEVLPEFSARVHSTRGRWSALGVALWMLWIGIFSPFPAQAQMVTYQTDPASGRVLKATYPNGLVVTYAYDANGNQISAMVADNTPPTAPGTISSSLSGTTALISWNAATDNSGAVAGYRYQINGGAWTLVPSGTSVSLTGLTAGQTYTVTVQAQDAAGNFGAGVSTTVTVPAAAPGAPGSLAVNNISGTTATLGWTAPGDGGAVAAYSYQLDGGSWVSVGTALTTSLSGLSYGVIHTFGVRALNTSNAYGPTATIEFSIGPTAPGAPTGSNITGTSATVSWVAATTGQGSGSYSYQVNGGTWSAFSSATSTSLTGLAYGTTYTVGVRAEDTAGHIGPTATGSFSTLPSAPGTPTASNIAGTTVTVSWGAATDHNGVTGYQYQLNSGSWVSAGTATSVNVSSLAYGTAYTINVRALDASGTGPAATGNFTTAPNVPGAPSFSNITASSATAAWSAASTGNSAISGYSYQLNGGAWSAYSTATSVNLTGLANGTTYTLAVRAQNAGGSVGGSSSGSFTTAPGTPGAPTFSNISGGSATVSWTAAASAVGITQYRYSLNGGASWTTVGTALAANLTGLSRSTTYTVQVQALNSSGIWSAASSASFTTTANYTDTFAFVSGSYSFDSVLDLGDYSVTETTIYMGYHGAYAVGYNQVPAAGSISPGTTATGQTVKDFYGTADYFGANTYFDVGGFSANPGAGWLQSLSTPGGTLTGSSASFNYYNGVASWSWTSNANLVPPQRSGTLTLVHQ